MAEKDETNQNAPPDANLADKSEVITRFSPEEEQALLTESNEIKIEANALFTSKDYNNAISRYEDALSSCPNYLYFERAVIQSNIAACYLKLEQWSDAVKSATNSIDSLTKLEKAVDQEKCKSDEDPKEGNAIDKPSTDAQDDNVEEEIISSSVVNSAPAPPPQLSASQKREADILRIRTKALLRRGRARSEAGGWQNLSGAEEDYRTLSNLPGLTAADMRTVRTQLRDLPPRTKAAQEKEMSEMWGKMRKLGDGILKPFGLSTDNFQMVKDEKTGGYSMSFNQGQGGGSS